MKNAKPIKTTEIEWYKYADRYSVLSNFDWCLVVLKPSNYKELDDKGLDYSDWISSFGFEKAWFGNDGFYVANPHGYGTEKVTDRVALVAPLPKENIMFLI